MAEICSSVECVISYVTFRMDSLCGVMCLEDSSKIIKCTHRFDGILCMRLLSVSLRQSTMSQKPVKLSNQRHQKHMFNNGERRTTQSPGIVIMFGLQTNSGKPQTNDSCENNYSHLAVFSRFSFYFIHIWMRRGQFLLLLVSKCNLIHGTRLITNNDFSMRFTKY